MADARKQAEEALRYDHDHANSPEVRRRLRGAIEPAPPDGAEVREAAERADKAMRDVFGGVDRFGDYCGHPVMPGKLAHAVQELRAALRSDGR